MSSFVILQDKMKTLTEIAEVLVNRYEEQDAKLLGRLEVLQEENLKLRNRMMELNL